MFGLVQFEDKEFYICKDNRINFINNKCSVKYTNGMRYFAILLAKDGKYIHR